MCLQNENLYCLPKTAMLCASSVCSSFVGSVNSPHYFHRWYFLFFIFHILVLHLQLSWRLWIVESYPFLAGDRRGNGAGVGGRGRGRGELFDNGAKVKSIKKRALLQNGHLNIRQGSYSRLHTQTLLTVLLCIRLCNPQNQQKIGKFICLFI